jgi:hypothetical protein
MKTLRMILVAALFAVGLNLNAQQIINATEAHVTITGEMTREGLAQLKLDLKAQGYEFNYAPDFDPQRKLAGIRYTITANDGAISGNGYHKTLLNPSSSLTIHVNKTNGTFSEDVVGDLSRN